MTRGRKGRRNPERRGGELVGCNEGSSRVVVSSSAHVRDPQHLVDPLLELVERESTVAGVPSELIDHR